MECRQWQAWACVGRLPGLWQPRGCEHVLGSLRSGPALPVGEGAVAALGPGAGLGKEKKRKKEKERQTDRLTPGAVVTCTWPLPLQGPWSCLPRCLCQWHEKSAAARLSSSCFCCRCGWEMLIAGRLRGSVCSGDRSEAGREELCRGWELFFPGSLFPFLSKWPHPFSSGQSLEVLVTLACGHVEGGRESLCEL